MSAEAEKLRSILTKVFGIRLDPGYFSYKFNLAFRRSLTTDPEEMAALILADCWEEHTRGLAINELTIDRVMNRIQKRLERSTLRQPDALPNNDLLSDKSAKSSPSRIEMIGAFLESLNPEESLLFERCVLNGQRVDDFSLESGIPRSTAYRHLGELRDKFKKFVHLKDFTTPG